VVESEVVYVAVVVETINIVELRSLDNGDRCLVVAQEIRVVKHAPIGRRLLF